MNISFFLINYKTDDQTLQCIESIQSLEHSPNDTINIHVFDNSEKSDIESSEFRKQIPNHVQLTFCEKNLGYFGCIKLAQENTKKDTDYIIYANPDLLFHKDFITQLGKIKTTASLIGPSIISKSDKFDQNPKYKLRLKKSKLTRLKHIHSNPISYTLFHALATLLEKRKKSNPIQRNKSASPIYALHGSAIIFKDVNFFINLPQYPCFLFGEELFLAEEARKANVKTEYHPSLQITDQRHGSISKLPKQTHRKYMLASIIHLIRTYYK